MAADDQMWEVTFGTCTFQFQLWYQLFFYFGKGINMRYPDIHDFLLKGSEMRDSWRGVEKKTSAGRMIPGLVSG